MGEFFAICYCGWRFNHGPLPQQKYTTRILNRLSRKLDLKSDDSTISHSGTLSILILCCTKPEHVPDRPAGASGHHHVRRPARRNRGCHQVGLHVQAPINTHCVPSHRRRTKPPTAHRLLCKIWFVCITFLLRHSRHTASATVQFHFYNAMFAGEESLQQLFRACSAERLFYTDVRHDWHHALLTAADSAARAGEGGAH